MRFLANENIPIASVRRQEGHDVVSASEVAPGEVDADVVRSRRYFPLWLGRLLSSFGDTLHYVALVVLVFHLTGQGLAVAALVAAEIVPAG